MAPTQDLGQLGAASLPVQESDCERSAGNPVAGIDEIPGNAATESADTKDLAVVGSGGGIELSVADNMADIAPDDIADNMADIAPASVRQQESGAAIGDQNYVGEAASDGEEAAAENPEEMMEQLNRFFAKFDIKK